MAASEQERYARRKQLFLEVIELDAADREAVLAGIPDQELADDVRRLLAAATEQLDTVAHSSLAGAAASGAESQIAGERSYRLIRELGRGGMGVVWLAERGDGEFARRVAIKQLQRGRHSDDLVRRFRAERQILASLDHPNIARLLDGGRASDGSPFFVMEYVEGLPIDQYCQQHELSIEERLRLFRTVCLAVQRAHQSLVIHRDLKPANILVTTAGEPKLLDFGIAKLLDPEALAVTAAETRHGEQPLTPRYASPEQVRGEPVTTATDVYALGVVLYELLTGASPYAAALAPMQLVRAICEEEVTAPSTMVSRTTGGAPTPEDPDRVRRRLRGDLDAIVLKALRKDARERYASAEQLADDVARHLDGLPVLARAGNWRYHAGKYLRRHWVAVAAGVAVLVALGTFLVDRNRRLEETTRERDKAKAAVEFLVDLFELADPNEARGSSITVREALDRGAERLERDRAIGPEVRAVLLEAIGRVYTNLGLYPPAEAQLARALELRRAGAGGPVELAESLALSARASAVSSDLERTEALLLEGLELATAHGQAYLEGQLRAALGRLVLDQGDYARGRDLMEQAYRRLLESGRSNPRELAEAATAWAIGVQAAGGEGREEAAVAAQHLDQAADADPVSLAMIRGELGLVYRGLGDPARGVELLDRALLDLRAVVPGAHAEVANILNNRAICRADDGDLEGALSDLEASHAMWLELMGPTHPRTALAIANIGNLSLRRGDWERARAAFEQALEGSLATLPENHPTLAKDLENLSEVALEMGDVARARERLDRARVMVEAEGVQLSWARWGCREARVLEQEGQLGEAEAAARRALEAAGGINGPPSAQLGLAALILADLLLDRGRLTDAEPLARRSHEVRLAVNGPRHLYTASAASLLGTVEVRKGNLEAGRDLLETALALQEASLLPAHPGLAETRLRLAAALAAQGNHAAAQELADRALASLRQANPRAPRLEALERQRRLLVSP